jgi:uncharacterized membrane protein YbhN (UPF0104 family)
VRARAIAGIITIRKILLTSLRLLVTAGLIWALSTRVDLGRAAAFMGGASPRLIVATVLTMMAANLIVGSRWHLVLRATAPSPGLVSLIKIVFVGLFFNQVLPTGVGGDAVRAWRLRKLGTGLGDAVRSILLDRACGYLVLVLVYAASLPSLLQLLPEAAQRGGAAAVLGAAVLGLLALVLLDCLPRPVLHLRLVAPLAELSRESRRLFSDPGRCGAVLGLSALTIGLTIVAFKLAADGVGVRLSLWSWTMIVPPVTLIQLIPVSLAGWGVREFVLVAALVPFGVPAEPALATSVLFGLCSILAGIPGGLIWLTGWDVARPQRPAASTSSP